MPSTVLSGKCRVLPELSWYCMIRRWYSPGGHVLGTLSSTAGVPAVVGSVMAAVAGDAGMLSNRWFSCSSLHCINVAVSAPVIAE